MDTGKTIKTHTNVPRPIPVQFPIRKKSDGDTSTGPDEVEKETGLPLISTPIRKEEEVPA